MLTFRSADPIADRDFILELHCRANYSSDQPWFRGKSYVDYRERWLSTAQPQSFLERLARDLQEGRAAAEICEENGRAVGYLQLSFYEIEGYGLRVAEVSDIAVLPGDQRRGIGRMMLARAEEIARARGADLMRAETGAWNEGSRALHEKAGFEVIRLLYEKRLH